MKKLQLSLMAASILAGIGSALAFKSPRFHNNFVYAQKNGTGFAYSNAVPGPPLSCTTNSFTACTLSTTATAAYFNMNNATVFPAQSTVSGDPIVRYMRSGLIYK